MPDTPLGRRAERIYRMYPQYFRSPREVYDMMRWMVVYEFEPDELIAERLLKLKGIRVE